MKKIKVVWLCHLSNEKLRETAQLKIGFVERLARKMFGKPLAVMGFDFAEWNTRALKLMTKLYPDVEIHVVSPMSHLSLQKKEFKFDGVYYHLYRPITESLIYRISTRFFKKAICYKKVAAPANLFIEAIQPDIVQLIGLENPYYAAAALQLDMKKYPTIGVLQTLMNDPKFKDNIKIDEESYQVRSTIEKQLIEKLHYIASGIDRYSDICKQINPHLTLFKGMLAVAIDVDDIKAEKEHDFVFFAKCISKCGDDAIKAFSHVYKHNPTYRLCMVGGYSSNVLQEYKQIASELGCLDNIDFMGMQPTLNDVLSFVKRSKVAILPLRFDAVSGTIREAIAMNVPVVSNITSGTPMLNEDRESILLSEPGDYETMAKYMIRLMEDDAFSATLVKNARKTYEEKYSNLHVIDNMVKAYNEIVKKEKGCRY